MLGFNSFYWEHIRKYVICFGTIFNDISIVRKSRADGTEKLIKCPLFYSTKSKQLERLMENPKLQNQWESEFPRLSFEITGISYAPYRKENTLHYSLKEVESGKSKVMSYSPAPYDISLELVSYTYYQEDNYQIMEQILPFFQPEYCVKVKEIPSLGLKRDVHIVLNGVQSDFDNSGDYLEAVKVYTTVFSFALKGFFYGPAEEKPIITNLDAQLWNMPSGEDWLMRYHAEGDEETEKVTDEFWDDNSLK